MKIVTSTGFGFTGSTAITDLISEYEGVQTCAVPGYELKFFHDVKGIFHLYNYLVRCNIPSAKHYAIRDYYNRCAEWATVGTKMNYEIFFNGHFMEYTNDYIKELGGEDFFVVHDFSHMTATQKLLYRVAGKVHKTIGDRIYGGGYAEMKTKPLTLFSEEINHYLYSVDEKSFDEITKRYMMRLFEGIQEQQIINMHELIPINMIDECSKYFDNVAIIATERDPRDIFLTARHKWATLDYPCEDVEVFCKYYRWLRKLLKQEKKKEILRIQFEDLVYHYEDCVKKIEEFVGLDEAMHVRKKTRFIPELSSKNCNLKRIYVEEQENIEYIEKELSEWIYDFG